MVFINNTVGWYCATLFKSVNEGGYVNESLEIESGPPSPSRLSSLGPETKINTWIKPERWMKGNCSFMESGKQEQSGPKTRVISLNSKNRTFDPSLQLGYCKEQTMKLSVHYFFFLTVLSVLSMTFYRHYKIKWVYSLKQTNIVFCQ